VTEAERAVGRAVSDAVPGWFGAEARLESLSAPARHSWSHQFRGVVAAADRSVEIAVKVPRWDEAPTLEDALAAGPQADTAREFDELVAVHRAVAEAGDERLTAVIPVGYLPAANAIVTEVLDAVPLRVLVRRGRVAAETLNAAGRWLRLYHARIGRVHDVPAPTGDLLAALADVGPSCPEGLRRLASRARDAVVRLEGAPVRVGMLHGDFNLSNVLVTPRGRVASLDTNRAEGPVAADLARFLTDLRTHKERALTLGMRPGRRRVEAWGAAFLAGYGPTGDGALPALLGVALVERWADLEDRLGGASAAAGLGLRAVRRLLEREALRIV